MGGSTLEELAPGMVALLCKWWGWNRREQGEPRPEEKEDRRNQADRLIGYALEDVGGLFVDQHGAPHALVGGAPVPLTSRCYSWLGPVAQAIIKFVEERGEYSGTSSELHSKLKPVAAQLGVDMDRDKAWPKSARWLWRRIKEVLPLLMAAGIEANRDRDASAKQISDGSVGRGDKSRTNSDKAAANSETLDSRSNGRESVYGRSNGSENTAKNAGFPITANKYGGFSETPASFDARFDETVTIADLKARREIASALRQPFEMHPEARNQTARQTAEVLYLWTNLGYEPDPADVQAALTKVDG